MSPPTRNVRRLKIVLCLTGVYLVAEVVGGILTHSLALLADAGHMLTDVGGLGLALAAIHFAQKPATPERTYGFYRLEILAALANAMLLIGISGFVLYEAYDRFKNPPTIASLPMLGVAVVGLVVNVASVVLIRGDSKSSLNMKGAYFEVLSDAVTSIGVIVAALVIWKTGWLYADPILSAGIGLFIIPRTWKLVKEAVGILLEGTPSDVNLASIREALAALPGVLETHDLHVWSLTSGMNSMSGHIVLRADARHDDVLRDVRGVVEGTFKIAHTTIQVESEGVMSCGTHT